MLTLTKVAASGAKMAIGDAGIAALLGYIVTFAGLVVLMYVIMVVGKLMIIREGKKARNAARAKAKRAKAAAEKDTQRAQSPAPGSAGEINLYDTPDREAAMIMAIVADKMGKPLNELRFISIKEVKE